PGFAPGVEAYGDHPHFIVSTSNDSSNESVSSHKQLLGNTQNSRHRYAASTSGNPSFSVLRQLQYLCELTQEKKAIVNAML
ncbi:hypothetical protein, partial [Klebsiella pneumoniae]